MTFADRNAWAEFKAESLEALERTADIRVEHREHRDDGFSTNWAAGMPPNPPALTKADVDTMVADALARQAADLRALINREIAEYHEAEKMRPVTSAVLASFGDVIFARVAKLHSEHDLRLSALLRTVEGLEDGASPKVIDLPNFTRTQRHG